MIFKHSPTLARAKFFWPIFGPAHHGPKIIQPKFSPAHHGPKKIGPFWLEPNFFWPDTTLDPFIDCVLSKTPNSGVSFIRESIRVSCVCLLSVCRSAAVGQMIRVFSDTKLGRTILSNQSPNVAQNNE